VVGLSFRIPGLLAGLFLIGVGGAGLGPSLLVVMGGIVPNERRGTGVGLLQFCGDVGGMLGPLVGTALLAGDTALPYLGTSALVLGLTPLAMWLASVESQRREAAVATGTPR
jgi:MFS family permease